MYEQLGKFITDRVAIDDEHLHVIFSHFKPLTLKKNEMINVLGIPARRMYFVNKGCLRVYFVKADGAEVTRRFAFENTFSTSLTSFITGEPLTEITQAIETSDLLYISRDDFYGLLDVIPAWEKFYRNYLEFAYVNNTKRLQSLATQDAAERYKLLLKESPHMVLRLSNKLVANYLNLSQEALSRLKSKI
ncbi:Crp/Fnr family transcriptional regulator [Mucilaginibacter sp. X4EP1]|jgi:CRP-like cAMP-binding protein|uniref:Crp/Fnr family transcriptional regulator n=1 Tax=Mucilaginibacter sp. X4EP1 TaxID=2723092 RepID=UPI002166EA6E|nr:Crp/Fnr family transcriptional regulator [Mucilaginibacter sp. X4EP1]MCS3811690.1 CRP-like cAMP-binding protein [Mucilaginibacter sp. X4EP1]